MPHAFPEARWRWTPLIALGGALLLAALLFCGIALTQRFATVEEPAEFVFRQVIMAPPPPVTPPAPPEPPQPQQDRKALPPEMAPEEPSIDLMPLDIALAVGPQDALAIGVARPTLEASLDTVAEVEDVFTFEDLAEAPRLLNAPPYRYPASLRREGIGSGKVVAQIRILPDGEAELIKIVSSTRPELEDVARSIIARARFTPPRIDGRPQAVTGMLPLVLKDH